MTTLTKRLRIDPVILELRGLRKAKNLTQYDAAEGMGYSISTIRYIENGLRTPSLPFINDYAVFLGQRLGLVAA